MKVDFMIIGAMKCGTSSLAKLLGKHPAVNFCIEKEPHFFSKSKNWKENIKHYESLFPVSEGKIYGEASTTYTFYPQFKPEIWEDIYEYNEKMKFIYIVRNPVDRIVSHYVHMVQRGYLDMPIEEAILSQPYFINIGRYYTQIKPYIDRFGRDNVLIIDYDDLGNAFESVLRSVADFLKLDISKFDRVKVHSNKSIGSNMIHHRYDSIFRMFRKNLRWVLPQKVKDYFWQYLRKRNLSKFKEKPVLSDSYKRIIINLNMLDIIELEKLTGMNLMKWKVV